METAHLWLWDDNKFLWCYNNRICWNFSLWNLPEICPQCVKESCSWEVSGEAFCYKTVQIEVPGELLSNGFCWPPCSVRAKHRRSCEHCRSWLEELCYKTAPIRVTAGPWVLPATMHCRSCRHRGTRSRRKLYTLQKLAKWAHQNQEAKFFPSTLLYLTSTLHWRSFTVSWQRKNI